MESVSIVPSTTADVDLDADHTPLQVDISDALSEKDKVKFTVHTRFALFCNDEIMNDKNFQDWYIYLPEV